jgi:hypothetical protein
MSSAAAAEEATVRRPPALVRVAMKVALYRAQPFFFTATWRAVASVPPVSWRETVRAVPLSARAHTEKSYFLPSSTRIPVL